MKNKLSVLCLCLLLVTVLIAGCGTTKRESAVSDSAKEPFHVSFAAGRPGDMWYALSHALATFINNESEWLTADVVSTAGVADNTRFLLGDEEAKKTHLNVTMLPGATFWGEGEYMPLQVGMMLMLNETWVTLDQNIKTYADFEGKTVVIPRDAPDAYTWIFRNMVELAGVKNVRFMHGGISDRLSALRDGACHVGVLPFDYFYPDEYALSASLIELGARGNLYFPNQGNIEENLDLIRRACKTDPFTGKKEQPAMGMVARPEAFGSTQSEPMAYVATPVFWSAGKEMPEEVVYEITRILYQAAESGEFASYHNMGKGITPEFVTMSYWESDEEKEKYYHPGALKFYKENNIPLKYFLEE